MPPTVESLAELTAEEREACTIYYQDATMLQACTQGLSGDFDDSPRMLAMIGRAAQAALRLDRAIQKFALSAGATVYSGHGRGSSVVGSLRGNPQQFVGLGYRYPGYISTSWDRAKAENFLRTRASAVGTPVLLKIRLRQGQNLLPLDVGTGQLGEGEYLLPRTLEFTIIDVTWQNVDQVEQRVLRLTLTASNVGTGVIRAPKPISAAVFGGLAL